MTYFRRLDSSSGDLPQLLLGDENDSDSHEPNLLQKTQTKTFGGRRQARAKGLTFLGSASQYGKAIFGGPKARLQLFYPPL